MKYNNMYYKGFPVDKLINDNRLIYESTSSFNTFIKSLFSDGTQGIYLNAQDAVSVSDLSSIKDLSGRNNHATQANATSRASLITDPSGYKSLKFDGIDDGYVTPSINFTNTGKMTVITAVRKLSDNKKSVVIECSENAQSLVNVGSFALYAPTNNVAATLGGTLTGSSIRNFSVSGLPAPFNAVTTNYFDITKAAILDSNKFRINSSIQEYVGDSAWSPRSSFGNHPLYICRRGGTSLPFNGQIYAILVIGKLLDDATTARIEKEFAKYIGVTL